MICQNCGHNNPEDSLFCEECGTRLIIEQSKTDESSSILQTEPKGKFESGEEKSAPITGKSDQYKALNSDQEPERKGSNLFGEGVFESPEKTYKNVMCPRCGRDDQIKKVPLVVLEGINLVERSGPAIGVGLTSEGKIGVGIGGSSSSGVSVSAFSARLGPPDEPKKGCLPVISYFLIGSGAIMGILMLGMGSKYYAGGQVVLNAILPLAGGILLLMLTNSNYKQKKEKYDNNHALWERLYYCHRDDIVFDPTTDFIKDANQLESYFKS